MDWAPLYRALNNFLVSWENFLSLLNDSFPGISNFVTERPLASLTIAISMVLLADLLLKPLKWFFRKVFSTTSRMVNFDSKTDHRLESIPLDRIVSNPYQPRAHIDENKLSELEKSIENYGIITPIQVTPIENNQYQLVAGERRVQACRNLGMKRIPALIRELSDEELIEVGFLENLQREEMGIVDKVITYNRLRTEFKSISAEELADRIGKPPEEIASRQWILDLPKVTQQALNRGILREETARSMLSLDEQAHRILIRDIAQNDLTTEQINERIDIMKESPNESGPDSKPLSEAAVDPEERSQKVEYLRTYREQDS